MKELVLYQTGGSSSVVTKPLCSLTAADFGSLKVQTDCLLSAGISLTKAGSKKKSKEYVNVSVKFGSLYKMNSLDLQAGYLASDGSFKRAETKVNPEQEEETKTGHQNNDYHVANLAQEDAPM